MSQQSLRVVPSARSDQTTKSIGDTANSYGVHDSMRYGARSIATEVQPHHPLENRLQQWDTTQDNLKFTMQRRMYGIHAPVRQLMERKIVSQSAPSLFLPKSNIGLDVLMGKDETIDVEDVLGDKDFSPELIDIHARAEAVLGFKA